MRLSWITKVGAFGCVHAGDPDVEGLIFQLCGRQSQHDQRSAMLEIPFVVEGMKRNLKG